MSQRFRRLVRFSAPVRLALLSLAFSLLISVPVLLFVYHQTDNLFEQRVRGRIDDRQANLVFGYKSGGIAGLTQAIDAEIESGADRGAAILLVDPAGRKLAGTLAAWPPTLASGTNWLEIRLYRERSRQSALYALRTIQLPRGYRLLLGTNIDDRERMRASLIEALIGALLLAIPLGLVGGLLLLRASARQAGAVANVASRIAAGDFSHRLDERAGSEEFALIAAAINAMLGRIEELVEQLRLVTDSLAHDLRSPLTRMRANVERAAGEAV
ncbi:MAG: HAMP domain-containing protein, partial [Sphingomicrobium sp.]